MKGLKLAVLKAVTEGEIDAAFASLVELQPAALVVPPMPSCLADESNSLRQHLAMHSGDLWIPHIRSGGQPDQLWN